MSMSTFLLLLQCQSIKAAEAKQLQLNDVEHGLSLTEMSGKLLPGHGYLCPPEMTATPGWTWLLQPVSLF